MEFKLFRQIMENLTALGSMVFLGLVFVYFLITNYNIAFELLFASIIGFIVIVIIRLLYFKTRPEHIGQKKPKGLVDYIDKSSFPSMHATNSFIMAIIIGFNQNNLYVFIFFILVAMLICITRRYLDKHFTLDLIVGMVLGITVSLFTIFVVF
ncbi:MAG: phosphatase PAP2 family protein [Candidatus Woesearchaeota archaeon]